MNLADYLKDRAERVDLALDACLPAAGIVPATIHGAMRHSVFAGGKRLRPVLAIAAAEACGGSTEAALPPACAVELMHTYSLVHDDLPCMDDDELRRGQPTCHVVYGEGMAVLCGDALLTEAFAVLARVAPTPRHAGADFVRVLAEAGGSRKLIGGQVLDLEGEGKRLDREGLVAIHEAKTGALLIASLRLGAMTADADEDALSALSDFGYSLGLAFQVIDDILDVTQTSEALGKTAGKDQAVEKSTYPSVLGLEESKAEAARLTARALAALEPFGERGGRLAEIAKHLLRREF